MDIVTQPRNIGKTERQKALLATIRAQKPTHAIVNAATEQTQSQVAPSIPPEAFLQHYGWTKLAGQRRRKPQKGRNKKQARKITRMHQ